MRKIAVLALQKLEGEKNEFVLVSKVSRCDSASEGAETLSKKGTIYTKGPLWILTTTLYKEIWSWLHRKGWNLSTGLLIYTPHTCTHAHRYTKRPSQEAPFQSEGLLCFSKQSQPPISESGGFLGMVCNFQHYLNALDTSSLCQLRQTPGQHLNSQTQSYTKACEANPIRLGLGTDQPFQWQGNSLMGYSPARPLAVRCMPYQTPASTFRTLQWQWWLVPAHQLTSLARLPVCRGTQ